MKEYKTSNLKYPQSFFKGLKKNDFVRDKNHLTGGFDDLMLLTKNSETHREVDSRLHAYDDLQLINKNHQTKEIQRIDPDIRASRFGRQYSLYRQTTSDKIDFEEQKAPRKHNRISAMVTNSDFLIPGRSDNKLDELSRRFDSTQNRSVSCSLFSGIKKKTPELSKLYEYEQEDDPDPFYAIYRCDKMTFLESELNDPLSDYIRVDMKRPDSQFQFKFKTSKKPKEKAEPEVKKPVYKRRYNEVEKIVRPVYFDENEDKKIYHSYIMSGPEVIDKRAEFTKRKKQKDCDINALTQMFYGFINPTYKDKDYKKVEEHAKRKEDDMKHDTEIIKKYLNYASMNTESSVKVKTKV